MALVVMNAKIAQAAALKAGEMQKRYHPEKPGAKELKEGGAVVSILLAAMLSEMHTTGDLLVALTPDEVRVIEPFLKQR